MKHSISSTAAAATTILYLAVFSDAQSSFSGCSVNSYYSGFNPNANSETLRSNLADLLSDTHRAVVPNTNVDDPGVGDTWAALIDLDQGSFPAQVKLFFSQEDVNGVPFGGSRGWVKEQLFPITRGVGLDGPDVTDLHNLRPISYLSNLVREDKYFGECGVLTKADTCVEPAEGAADGSCTCNRIYTPPPEVRGDVARALMYMDVRYDGRDENTLDLRLTDCPFQHDRDMAYLSQMLTWHLEDPVDDAERARNDRLCETWQGNRNPFIDFEELPAAIWGSPLPLPAIGERQIYEACESIPTQAPTTFPNQCERLDPGDIYIWLLNSVSADVVGLFAFEDLDSDFKLYMTTNPWNQTGFVNQGGTISLEMPGAGIDGGTAFGYGDDNLQFSDDWETESGKFELSPEGQPVFLYCLDNFENPKPLLAFMYGNSTFVAPNATFALGETVRPKNLGEMGVIQLATGFSNAVFSDDVDGFAGGALKASIRNANNWDYANTGRFAVPAGATALYATVSIFGIVALVTTWLL
eukprot:scaffold456_cov73-Cylindrotheca_fusiformis.AAC.4